MSEGRREFTRRGERIEELVTRVESTGDPAIRAVAQELLQAVIELHGIALERMLDAVAELPAGEAALSQLAEDELVSGVLSLHGIHPIDLQTRIGAAVEKAKPYMRSHGGDVELASVEEDGTVRVRLQGTCGSCSSSAETLKQHVESAIYEAAPEVAAIVAESLPKHSHSDFVILQAT
jgi:Fe-S cluster biogenesis protein NfuA